VLGVRVSEDAFRLVAERALRADVDTSHMARRMLIYATMHMPEGWVPPTRKSEK